MKLEEMASDRLKGTGIKSRSRFILRFLLTFSLLYMIQLLFIGITTPGGLYVKFIDQYFNYIAGWRNFCIDSTAFLLESLGYPVQIKPNGLSVEGHSGFRLIYSCLGYGVMSGFSAFVLSYPASRRSKIIFLAVGLLSVQLLNNLRLVLLSIYYVPKGTYLDHHLWFNCLLYGCVALTIYSFVNLQSVQKCR